MTEQDLAPGRRAVLTGCLAACSVGVLAGCSQYGTPSQPDPAGQADGGAGGADAGQSSGADDAQGAGGAAALAGLDDVPVGGALILADAGVVLVRTDAESVHGLSATCTHAGCSVSSVDGDVVSCPCHGSKFRIADGSVANGPAKQPLAPVAVQVENGQVVKA